jgi:hypothetical protein
MADPLSITASIITLIHVSVQVTVLIKQFRDEVSAVDATLTGLLNDVDGFQRVLESMKETIEESNNRETLQEPRALARRRCGCFAKAACHFRRGQQKDVSPRCTTETTQVEKRF